MTEELKLQTDARNFAKRVRRIFRKLGHSRLADEIRDEDMEEWVHNCTPSEYVQECLDWALE